MGRFLTFLRFLCNCNERKEHSLHGKRGRNPLARMARASDQIPKGIHQQYALQRSCKSARGTPTIAGRSRSAALRERVTSIFQKNGRAALWGAYGMRFCLRLPVKGEPPRLLPDGFEGSFRGGGTS